MWAGTSTMSFVTLCCECVCVCAYVRVCVCVLALSRLSRHLHGSRCLSWPNQTGSSPPPAPPLLLHKRAAERQNPLKSHCTKAVTHNVCVVPIVRHKNTAYETQHSHMVQCGGGEALQSELLCWLWGGTGDLGGDSSGGVTTAERWTHPISSTSLLLQSHGVSECVLVYLSFKQRCHVCTAGTVVGQQSQSCPVFSMTSHSVFWLCRGPTQGAKLKLRGPKNQSSRWHLLSMKPSVSISTLLSDQGCKHRLCDAFMGFHCNYNSVYNAATVEKVIGKNISWSGGNDAILLW